ncbi:MAG: DUF4398 domain-containing protein [Deltaproteobacteria bacterium]|nr:DUF4398 domain-containing protein [Deltaproteobacteria bacterium]
MRTLFALALLILCGCGPVGATAVIADADIAVSRAHAADGQKLAPYETTSADLYLQKAREADGHAKYSLAMDLAKKAQGFAESASLKAAQARTGAVPIAPSATARPVDATGPAPATAAPASPPPATPKPAEPPRQVIKPAPQGNAPLPPPPASNKQPINPEAP